MRKLAGEVGVTAPALYRHYASKEEVLADVVREAYREFTAHLYRALGEPTPLARFLQAGEGYLDFALRHPRWYELLFMPPDQLGMHELPDDLTAQGCAIHQFWVDRVRECMDAGLLKEGDPTQVSLSLWAHAHGMVTLYHHGHLQVEEEAFRRMFEMSGAFMFMGVGTEAMMEELERRLGEMNPVEIGWSASGRAWGLQASSEAPDRVVERAEGRETG